MNLYSVSIVPIELFSRKNVVEVFEKISPRLMDVNTRNIKQISKEIYDDEPKIFTLINTPSSKNRHYIAFYQTSIACVIITGKGTKKNSLEVYAENPAKDELSKRNDFHKKIISGEYAPIHDLNLDTLNVTHDYPRPKINYVFGFYAIEYQSGQIDYDWQRALAKGTDEIRSGSFSSEPAPLDALDVSKLENVDTYPNCCTFITGASLACSVQTIPDDDQLFYDTLKLLAELAYKTQMIRNRCVAINEFIDEILTRKGQPNNSEAPYRELKKSLEEARSVISKPYLGRAGELFRRMVETSKIKEKLDRLDKKIALIAK